MQVEPLVRGGGTDFLAQSIAAPGLISVTAQGRFFQLSQLRLRGGPAGLTPLRSQLAGWKKLTLLVDADDPLRSQLTGQKTVPPSPTKRNDYHVWILRLRGRCVTR